MADRDGQADAQPLVGLGSPGRDREPATPPAPSPPEPSEPPEQPIPWWASTGALVGCLALAQTLLLTSWSGFEALAVTGCGPPEGVAGSGELGSRLEVALRPAGLCPAAVLSALAAGAGTLLAARAAREAGGGRSAQLTLALALLACPLLFRLVGSSAEVSAMSLFASALVWALVRALRLRTVVSGAVCGVAAGVLLLATPAGWVASLPAVLCLVLVGWPSFVAAGVALAILTLARTDGLTEWALSAPEVVRSDAAAWFWSSPLAIGLPMLALAAYGVSRAPSVVRWLVPLPVAALGSLASALVVGLRSEAIFPPLLIFAMLGAVTLGSRVEVSGRLAVAGLLLSTGGLGLLFLAIALWAS